MTMTVMTDADDDVYVYGGNVNVLETFTEVLSKAGFLLYLYTHGTTF
jgi:hypothetical protein